MKLKFYPIIIFTFNRPKNLLKLIKSLKINKNFQKHEYYFFCDGPKNNSKCSDKNQIKKNLDVIKSLSVKKKL